MGNIIDAVSMLNGEVTERYLNGEPVPLRVNGYPDLLVTRYGAPYGNPLEWAEYLKGAPRLGGEYPLRNVVVLGGVAGEAAHNISALFDHDSLDGQKILGNQLGLTALTALAVSLDLPIEFTEQ